MPQSLLKLTKLGMFFKNIGIWALKDHNTQKMTQKLTRKSNISNFPKNFHTYDTVHKYEGSL